MDTFILIVLLGIGFNAVMWVVVNNRKDLTKIMEHLNIPTEEDKDKEERCQS